MNALILGLRRCSAEEAQQYFQSLERATCCARGSLAGIGCEFRRSQCSASPLARVLPPGIRTLEDLFKLPLPKLTKASLTRRYSAAPGEELDRLSRSVVGEQN